MAINVRRILVAALYDKTIRLSVKGMTETNSGKLISLINGDLFQIERGLSFAPLIVAAPIVNLIAYYFVSLRIGWKYTGICFGFWVFLLIC